MAMRVLLTNDDGIEAEGLQTLRRALAQLSGIDLAVMAIWAVGAAFIAVRTFRWLPSR